MRLLQRVRFSEVQWLPLLPALLLTAVGVAFVASATADPSAPGGWGPVVRMQLIWWILSLVGMGVALHVPAGAWRQTAWGLFAITLIVQAGMIVMAGSSLVPTIKGAHNWIALHPRIRIQPSEFYKITSLIVAARLLTEPGVDPRQLRWVAGVLAVAGAPAVLILREDLGSALTFGPMLLGMLLLAGMHIRHLLLMMVAGAGVLAIGISQLPRDGYQWRRLAAWLDPAAYALEEGYQTERALRSLGSGQWFGKGYGTGDQNQLGWLPEKHTDMIFAVVGEETGFLGCTIVLALFLALGWACLYSAMRCRDPFGRLVIGGFGCLVLGQTMINLAVVTGLMPVTGITLPFLSYGGSSLLGTYLGIGICLGVSVARHRQFGHSRLLGH